MKSIFPSYVITHEIFNVAIEITTTTTTTTTATTKVVSFQE